ncbi:Uncharacterised protein [Vibrio cholerae]|nr:Uncharacterised protein [Vibrio cholerae]
MVSRVADSISKLSTPMSCHSFIEPWKRRTTRPVKVS